MFQRNLTEEEIRDSILKGHEAAHYFMATNPTWDQIEEKITRLDLAVHQSIENFNPVKYKKRRDDLIKFKQTTLKAMFLGAFSKTQELKELELWKDEHFGINSMFGDSHLLYETQLPVAITIFRTDGENSDPDYSVPDILHSYSHFRAA